MAEVLPIHEELYRQIAEEFKRVFGFEPNSTIFLKLIPGMFRGEKHPFDGFELQVIDPESGARRAMLYALTPTIDKLIFKSFFLEFQRQIRETKFQQSLNKATSDEPF